MYAARSLASGDLVPGISDIDLVAVVPGDPRAEGREHARARRRWDRLGRLAPGRARRLLPDLCVYEEAELRAATASSILTTGLGAADPPAAADAALFGASPPHDEAELRARPGLAGPGADWRLVAGPERRPRPPLRDRPQVRLAAWLELQFWWRTAFSACAQVERPWAAYACVKMVSEPARIWMELAGERPPSSRAEVLRAAPGVLPMSGEACAEALDLLVALPRSPRAPASRFLGHLSSLSGQVASLLERELAGCPRTEVRLTGADPAGLLLPGTARSVAGGGAGAGGDARAPRRHLPLVDWRGLVVPSLPDECLALLPEAPLEAGALTALASGAPEGVVPAVPAEGLLVLPAARPWRDGILRALQSRLTDPVSFALAGGAATAAFCDADGLSARDWARRAVGEHAAWLARDWRDQYGPPTIREWLDGRAEGVWPTTRAIAKLLTSARAGLFWESLREGRPELHLGVASACAQLAERTSRTAVEPALESYRVALRGGEDPHPSVVGPLRRAVLGLPAYAEAASGS